MYYSLQEKCHPDLFLPPNRASKSYRRFTLPIGTTPEEIEREDESRKRFILESVKEMVESKGPGHLQSYQVDEKTVKDPTSEPKATETELFEIEQRLMINSVLDARESESLGQFCFLVIFLVL